jgi:hypothetical protein
MLEPDKFVPLRYSVSNEERQGYVTKALASAPHCMNVLALESLSSQIEGSRQRDKLKRKSKAVSSAEKDSDVESERRITYERLQVNGSNMNDSVDRWMKRNKDQAREPVLLMGLHTCGGLTPSVIRSHLLCCKPSDKRSWYSAGLVIVGCCYHLMDPQGMYYPRLGTTKWDQILAWPEFPMSRMGSKQMKKHGFVLEHDHLMLAAHSPATWLKDELSIREAEISLRKIAYRAVYACLDFRCAKLGLSRAGARVYKVRWRECETLEGYITTANTRQKGDSRRLSALLSARSSSSEEKEMVARMQVLQTLRCLLGSLMESMLLVDRFVALREGTTGHVSLIALFNEMANSPRNMALVVK